MKNLCPAISLNFPSSFPANGKENPKVCHTLLSAGIPVKQAGNRISPLPDKEKH